MAVLLTQGIRLWVANRRGVCSSSGWSAAASASPGMAHSSSRAIAEGVRHYLCERAGHDEPEHFDWMAEEYEVIRTRLDLPLRR